MIIKRNFILGEEWLYYKVYCGKRTADIILINIIKPLTEKLLNQKLVDQWFFIRYLDPKNHLRIRFHCSDITKIGIIIRIIKDHFLESIDNGIISHIQLDTYSRELERYGFDTIEEAEQLFFIDSQVCINSLTLIEDDQLLFLFVLRYIDTMLSIFGLSIEEKISFSKNHFKAFKQEFNADKSLNKQLNVKYQKLRMVIENFMIKPSKEYGLLVNLLLENESELHKLASIIIMKIKNTENTKNKLLSSYIHMTVNRLFRDNQRLHELVVYSCLFRFYEFQNNTNA